MKTVNILPTHFSNEEETSFVPVLEISVSGTPAWNFFAFRKFLLVECQKAVSNKVWTDRMFERFSVAVEHCTTHEALRFVADGFHIRLSFPHD